MRIGYDPEVDALSITFRETTVTTEHLTERIAADYDMAINRDYRESVAKVRQAVETFHERNPAFAVLLGDMVDKSETVLEV